MDTESNTPTEAAAPEGAWPARARATPWRTRFEDQLARGLEQMLAVGVPTSPAFTRDELIDFARYAKRDDVFHSTAIEGYRVTGSDLDELFPGSPTEASPREVHPSEQVSREDIEKRLALQGYANAFDRVIDRIPSAPGPWAWTTDHILDCHVDLWTPSAMASGVAIGDLRSFRSRAAYLPGSGYVPPPPGKLWDLLEGLEEFLADTAMPGAARAALGHWGFETIHPLHDGNGRVGRLLMNASLAAEGYPWVTIRVSDRAHYLHALNKGHSGDGLTAWAVFFTRELERARQSMEDWQATPHSHSR